MEEKNDDESIKLLNKGFIFQKCYHFCKRNIFYIKTTKTISVFENSQIAKYALLCTRKII